VARKTSGIHFALLGAVALLVLALAPAAPAAPSSPGGGGGGKRSCTQRTPGISIDNNWQWGQPGSWGQPGQTLTYAINVINYDVGCGSSTFTLSSSAPNGFSFSAPSSTLSLRSSSSAYMSANITSPTAIGDGDYALTFTVRRASTLGSTSSGTSYYKVYSSDSVAPTLYWPNPADGMTISGNSYQFIVSSSDDHAVRKIELYIDNVYKSTALCDNIAYECQLASKWSLSGGQHTATFKSYDWMGNVGALTSAFTVG
jgi:Bacterial Ig domain